MNRQKKLNKIRVRRKIRARSRLFGTQERPRLSVFRSNRNMFLQLIDDKKGMTLASVSTRELKEAARKKSKVSQAELIAAALFQKAKKLGITKAIFDRGFYQYHGRVKAVAEVLRKEGLQL
ncbi:50S ribosomal protein L18 [Candidatus Wolfebacteria bacterium RIFCSPLOWO2_01_FULL_45_19]|uniref:Large ribosomal subunit protein uL18 n=1 Tax=Candidatus Wolfebacteria bacterium RIFCSPLOWO2_01_FULL_45_19 TaxID=1802557 RepID=A0A1F8DSP7_9BACT|nr:MAG: 50S ribosomal protein L18 [Parcubacteria group bacterium GW2011_GWB1_45_9]OGM91614.1 MAG: 50S ribosomal protein L18 [Candidatus Wolfebacteria bacterium RIFCSPLOWO2_01_FULL_45_19]